MDVGGFSQAVGKQSGVKFPLIWRLLVVALHSLWFAGERPVLLRKKFRHNAADMGIPNHLQAVSALLTFCGSANQKSWPGSGIQFTVVIDPFPSVKAKVYTGSRNS